MKKLVGIRANVYSHLKDNNDKDTKGKGTKTSVIKRKLKFQDYKNCLETAQIENRINHLPGTLFIGPKEFPKNIYHETFFSLF